MATGSFTSPNYPSSQSEVLRDHYKFSVTVFSPSNLMALINPILLKKTAYVTFFIARWLFTIVGMGSFSKTHTLLS
ncbi:hypothetical protein TNCV_2032661 [Trichonephila clavipes]|nr:hypothetical protein TNCV_2032661 [Trichonephila clavipes]